MLDWFTLAVVGLTVIVVWDLWVAQPLRRRLEQAERCARDLAEAVASLDADPRARDRMAPGVLRFRERPVVVGRSGEVALWSNRAARALANYRAHVESCTGERPLLTGSEAREAAR